MPASRAIARAKLNLYLHVVGRRDDGYHRLDSLVAFAAIGDVVAVEPAPAFELAIDGPFAADLTGENLIARAARALDARAPARVRLTKMLPVASGVGGGSSDAATTLILLDRLWGLGHEAARLARIGLTLGADVPVCLHGRPAFMGGIGDEIAPAPPLPAAGLVLVNPRIPCPTPAVFRRRQGPFGAAARFTEAPRDAAGLARLLAARGNDLTLAAIAEVPAIAEILAAIEASPGCLLARLSGSGATCFGLYADESRAAEAAAWITDRGPAWWVAPSRLDGGE